MTKGLIEILRKMQVEGGCKLKDSEWQALYATEVNYVRLWRKPDEDAEQEAGAAKPRGEEEESENSDASEEEVGSKKLGRLLRDPDGVYRVGDPRKITEFLLPDNCHAVMPCIPLEELHASSVQHTFPECGWLLHTRRVKCTVVRGRCALELATIKL